MGLGNFLLLYLLTCKLFKKVWIGFLLKLEILLNGSITSNKKYSSASARDLIRSHKEKETFVKLFGSVGHIPRMAFITWLVFKKGLLTRQKLIQWGCVQEEDCVLCNNAVEEVNHLFFSFPFSKAIWEAVLRRNGISRGASRWDDEKVRVVQETKGVNLGLG